MCIRDRHYTYRPNLVKQNFTVEKPNSIWVSDITYVKVNTSIAYICVIIDLFSRKVISHAVAEFADAELTIHTFKLAYQNRNHPQGLTFHSDQGAQYTAFSFRQLLLDFNIHQSFSNIGNPLDNAVAVSYTHLDVYKRQAPERARMLTKKHGAAIIWL